MPSKLLFSWPTLLEHCHLDLRHVNLNTAQKWCLVLLDENVFDAVLICDEMLGQYVALSVEFTKLEHVIEY